MSNHVSGYDAASSTNTPEDIAQAIRYHAAALTVALGHADAGGLEVDIYVQRGKSYRDGAAIFVGDSLTVERVTKVTREMF